jgi:molybdopterin converting factor small subunit
MPTVRLREPLKRLASGRSEHALEARTVSELLHALEQSHPALTGWILDERGKLRPHINVFVNGELGNAGSALDDGDRVDVIPAISGGAYDRTAPRHP